MTFTGTPRILITGAHGFVGRYLVERLLAILPAGGELILIDAQVSNGSPGARCRHYAADITDADHIERLIAAEKPTHLIHLAGIAAVTQASAEIRKAWAVNFTGVQNLALAVEKSAPDCRFVFCSSAEVYGASFAGGACLNETALLQPMNVYGAAKAAADIMLGQMARNGLKAIRLRPVNHTGPGQSIQFVVPAFAAQIARIERGECAPVISVGDLASARDFLDVRDVVDAYVRVLVRFDDIPNGSAMNIASGEARTVRAVLDELLSMSEQKIEIRIDPERLRRSDTPVVVADATLARQRLQWQPSHAWTDTLRAVLDYWRAQT